MLDVNAEWAKVISPEPPPAVWPAAYIPGMGSPSMWIGYTFLDSFVGAGRVGRSPWQTPSTPGISPTSSNSR